MKITPAEARKCPVSQRIVDKLVSQIAHELGNHNLYKNCAAFFGVRGLAQLQKYYELRAKEEYNHHQWIYDFLVDNDAEFSYPIVEIQPIITDMIQTFEVTVTREIETTKLIDIIVELALEEKDWATFGWLNKLLRAEQCEEESISRAILDMAKLDGSWLTKQEEILEFYEKD